MNNGTDKIIRLENVVKSFDGEQILKSIHLEIGDKEFVTLLRRHGVEGDRTLKVTSFVCLLFLWMTSVYVLLIAGGDPSLFVLACGLFISVFLRRKPTDG